MQGLSEMRGFFVIFRFFVVIYLDNKTNRDGKEISHWNADS